MTTAIMNPRIRYERCPLCSSDRIRNALDASCVGHPLHDPALPGTITWASCEGCNHIFTEGYFSDEARRLILGKVQEDRTIGFDIENQRRFSARIVDQVISYRDSGTWLDVGAGNGSLAFTAAEYGFFPVALEPRESNVNALREIGLEAHSVDVTQLDHVLRYDVVSMVGTLPQVPYPGQALEAAHRLLKDDGILFLSLPNSDSILWVTLNNTEANPYWGELEHYHNFGRNRLYALLREHGFEPLRFGISDRSRACMEVTAMKVPRA